MKLVTQPTMISNPIPLYYNESGDVSTTRFVISNPIPLYYNEWGDVSTTPFMKDTVFVQYIPGRVSCTPVQVDIEPKDTIDKSGAKFDIVIDGYKFYGAFWATMDTLNGYGTLYYDFFEQYPKTITETWQPPIRTPIAPKPKKKTLLFKKIMKWLENF